MGYRPVMVWTASATMVMLGIARADFMLDASTGELKQIETNTISAAFSCAAPRVQQLHHARVIPIRPERFDSCGLDVNFDPISIPT